MLNFRHYFRLQSLQQNKTHSKNVKRVLNSLKVSYEIIVVDNGSSDDTYEKALEITDINVKILRYEDNQGKGYALLHGLKHSTGDLIMFFRQ